MFKHTLTSVYDLKRMCIPASNRNNNYIEKDKRRTQNSGVIHYFFKYNISTQIIKHILNLHVTCILRTV